MFVTKTHLMVYLDALEQKKFFEFLFDLKNAMVTDLTLLFLLGMEEGGGGSSGIGLI